MKKTYSKPDVLFDSFSLCNSIAGACEVKTNLPSQGGCGLQFGADTIFLKDIEGCAINPDFFGMAEGTDIPCYHVPMETNSLFRS
jgi:hypothetical protein